MYFQCIIVITQWACFNGTLQPPLSTLPKRKKKSFKKLDWIKLNYFILLFNYLAQRKLSQFRHSQNRRLWSLFLWSSYIQFIGQNFWAKGVGMKCGITLGNGLGNTWELGIRSGNLVRTDLGTFVGTLQSTPLPLSPRKMPCPRPPPKPSHWLSEVSILKPFCHHLWSGLIPIPKRVGYLLSITDLSRGQFCHFFTKYFGSTLFSTISSFAAFTNPSIWHIVIWDWSFWQNRPLKSCWNAGMACQLVHMAGKWTAGALDS